MRCVAKQPLSTSVFSFRAPHHSKCYLSYLRRNVVCASLLHLKQSDTSEEDDDDDDHLTKFTIKCQSTINKASGAQRRDTSHQISPSLINNALKVHGSMTKKKRAVAKSWLTFVSHPLSFNSRRLIPSYVSAAD